MNNKWKWRAKYSAALMALSVACAQASSGDAATGKALADRGDGEDFPAIAGQYASYIGQQIRAWRDGMRSNDAVELMTGVAERLTDAPGKERCVSLIFRN